jgi:sensor histidine kinase regulating citrate/malate metabolism
MAKFFSKRRLKIAEQIIIVIFFAVIIPMTISAFIINNVNQQSNRAQLRDAAVMIANIVSEEVDVFQHSIDNELTQIATTLEYYDSPEKANEYLSVIIKKLPFYKELSIVTPWQMKQYSKFDYDKMCQQ